MGGMDKQVALLRGKPVISHSLRVFEDSGLVGPVVLVMSADNLEAGESAVAEGKFAKVIAVVVGGERRQDSVKIGLDVLAGQDTGRPEFVAVHDGARPFIDSEILERGLITAEKIGAAIAAVPVKDTIKVAPTGWSPKLPTGRKCGPFRLRKFSGSTCCKRHRKQRVKT